MNDDELKMDDLVCAEGDLLLCYNNAVKEDVSKTGSGELARGAEQWKMGTT